MSIELCIQQLEKEIKIRDELIVAVKSLMLNEIGHCVEDYCTEDNPCRDCKDRRHILDLIDNPKRFIALENLENKSENLSLPPKPQENKCS